MERIYKFFKYFMCVLPACKRIYAKKSFHILTSEETIQYVIDNKCSVARFGDGELGMMFTGRTTGFQESHEELKKGLAEVLCCQDPSLLVCLPLYLSPEKVAGEISFKTKRFWDFWSFEYFERLVLFLEHNGLTNTNKAWGDTLMTRPYIDWKYKKQHADKIFPKLRKIWEDKDILIIEGTESRLGVGNDLFSNVKSIRRVLAPSENAFCKRDEIVEYVEKIYNGELILMALGPTATILALDFAKRKMQAIDIGHVDIEYSWYLLRTSKKVAIKGKYTNETMDGKRNISPCNDNKYLEEIIKTIL